VGDARFVEHVVAVGVLPDLLRERGDACLGLALGHDPARSSTRAKWAGGSGITESREMRTSAGGLSTGSTRKSASGPGTASAGAGFRSTTTRLGSPSLGSGYGPRVTSARPTTDFSFPVW